MGRFPIRPSISGIEGVSDPRSGSPSDRMAPPIPQRSHARVASTNAPTIAKRPGIAPLLTGGNDISRSRSETASSSASLRQRRQGFVPQRNPTGDLNPVSEVASQMSTRSSHASTIKPTHSRTTSSISSVNGFLSVSSGESSSGAVSPTGGPGARFGSVRRLSSLPENRNSKVQPSNAVKSSKRLLLTLHQLQRPINDVAVVMTDGTPRRSTMERLLFSAHAQVQELDRLLGRLESGMEDGIKDEATAMQSIVRTSVSALKAFGAVTAELKRNTSKLVSIADGIYIRCLMFQIYGAMVEARNVCSLLGFKIKHRSAPRDTPRVTSHAWSSKTVTPTQPKVPNNKRLRGATILKSMASTSTLRGMPAPPVPLNVNGSRTNTMTSISSATPRSGESFSTLLSSVPTMSRSNTTRSVTDGDEGDEQFDRIFLKLKAASDMASQALPHCRGEFIQRRENSQRTGHTRLAHHWSMALNKCETVIVHNKTLKKRLEVVKVNDPGIRYQKDFWQLCDAFVHVRPPSFFYQIMFADI